MIQLSNLDKIYPIRKTHLKVQALSRYVKLINFHEGSAELITRIQALAVEFCSGEYHVESIIKICSESFRLNFDEVYPDIIDLINKYQFDFIFLEKAADHPIQSNPLRILEKGERTNIQNPYRDDYPYHLTFSLTYLCNHRCRYCCNSSGIAAKNELHLNEWLNLVDDAANLGVMGITFSGGEPSLIPGFNTIIKQTVEKGIYPIISTNGSNFTENKIKELADTGANFIHLSLSAASELLYDNMEGCKGNFKKAIHSLRLFKKYGFVVRIKTVLMSLNVHEIGDLIDLCFHEGIETMHIEPYRLTHIAREGAELLPSVSDLKMISDLVHRKQLQYEKQMKIHSPAIDDLAWKNKKDIVKCGGIKSELTILPTGDITFCEALATTCSEFSIGNIRHDSLKEIWYSSKPDDVLKLNQKKIEEPCKSCKNLKNCMTGCFMCSLIYSDNPWSIDPRCWKAQHIENNAFRNQVQS